MLQKRVKSPDGNTIALNETKFSQDQKQDPITNNNQNLAILKWPPKIPFTPS